jgi:hypothetical protein
MIAFLLNFMAEDLFLPQKYTTRLRVLLIKNFCGTSLTSASLEVQLEYVFSSDATYCVVADYNHALHKLFMRGRLFAPLNTTAKSTLYRVIMHREATSQSTTVLFVHPLLGQLQGTGLA